MRIAMAMLVSGPIARIVTCPGFGHHGAHQEVHGAPALPPSSWSRIHRAAPAPARWRTSRHAAWCPTRCPGAATARPRPGTPGSRCGWSPRGSSAHRPLATFRLRLPATVVIPRISSSGELSTKNNAIASSCGGNAKSVSKMIFCARLRRGRSRGAQRQQDNTGSDTRGRRPGRRMTVSTVGLRHAASRLVRTRTSAPAAPAVTTSPSR